MPDKWTFWTPRSFSGETHDDIEERGGHKYYCPKCGPECGKCGNPVVRASGRPRRDISTRTYLHDEGGNVNRPVFCLTDTVFHEDCYQQHCRDEAFAKQRAEEQRLAEEQKAKEAALIKYEQTQLQPKPINFKQLAEALFEGASALIQIGPISVMAGLVLAVIFSWSWFWWVSGIGTIGGFLFGFWMGHSSYQGPGRIRTYD